MKKIFLLLFNVVLFFNLFSQPYLYKEWYSSDNKLKITHKKSTINSFYYFDKTIVKQQSDCTLLTLINHKKTESLKKSKDICQFIIIKSCPDTLILSAVNEKSKKYFRNQDTVTFISHIWLSSAAPNFHFQNLTFEYGASLGTKTEIYEIDSLGNFVYTIKSFYSNESFSGTLKSKEFNKLIDLLSHYNFSNYDTNMMEIDAPSLFIEIKHNNTISKMETHYYFSKDDKINVLLDFVLSLKDFIKK